MPYQSFQFKKFIENLPQAFHNPNIDIMFLFFNTVK